MERYKGFEITISHGVVSVFDPRFPGSDSIHDATSIDRAKKWVDDNFWAGPKARSLSKPA